MKNLSSVAVVLLFSTSLCSAQAIAKNKSPKTKDVDSTKLERNLAQISVIANKSETDISKYAGQIGIADKDDLARTASAIESMKFILGIDTGNDFGRQAGQQFYVRGFGYGSEEKVIIEQNGVKRSPALYSNQISTFRTDNDILKRIEVVKGANSVLHGSGAIGGIVSMQTKNVDDFINEGNKFGAMLGTRYESNNMHSFRAALAGRFTENLGLLAYAKRAKFGNTKLADGGNNGVTKVISDEEIDTFFTKAEWSISDEHLLEASLFKYKEDLTTGWQSLWFNEPTTAPTIGTISQRDFSLIYKYLPRDNDFVNLSLQYYNSKAFYDRDRKGIVKSGARNVAVDLDYKNTDKRWGVNLKNESVIETDIVSHKIVFGAEYENRSEESKFVVKDKVQDSGSHPSDFKDLGVYLQDIIAFKDLELTLGTRYDRFTRGVKKPGKAKYTNSKLSPKIAVAYELFDGVNLLASYAQTFRAPTPHETSSNGPLNPHYWYIPNTNLKPELARDFEFGFSMDRKNLLANDELAFKATYFTGNIKNMINIGHRDDLGLPPLDPNAKNRTYAQYKNISDAKRKGFEAEAAYKIAGFGLNLGYGNLKLTDKQTKKRINVYADKLTFGTGYLYAPARLFAGFDAVHYLKPKRDVKFRVIGKTKYEFVDSSFTIVNFKGSWAPKGIGGEFLSKGFRINFGINNIFDKKYINAARFKNSELVGKGRNFYIDIQKIF